MKYSTTFLLFTLFLFLQLLFAKEVQAQEGSSNILINEFMSSNSSTIADEDGDFSDWIELYNPTEQAVELEGWGLSDNTSNPYKWVFPEVTMKPGEYLVIWASGKNRAVPQLGLRQGILQQVYLDISGYKVADLINSPSYPGSPSYSKIFTHLFEAPVDVNDNYGQRMHGLLKAPETGYYTFWISGDDNCQLFLSSDDQPSNVALIAEVPEWTNSREWEKYPQQKSEEIHLIADQYYYISALMKEEGGGDNLAVGWKKANGVLERPMSASHIFVAAGELHTNFSISSDGEPLLLTDPVGETVHSIPEVKLTSNISYGLLEGKSGFWYFDLPTPGDKNDTPAYNQILESSVEFSHGEGFYTQGFDLTLSSIDPDVTIYYTLDGSEPSSSNLAGTSYTYKNNYDSGSFLSRDTKTYIYDDPIRIIDRSTKPYELGTINTIKSNGTWLPRENYFKGTVVRVKAVKSGALSLYSSTQTYFVSKQGGGKYDLPVISVATDESGLFDYNHGIYVAGKIASDWVASHNGEGWDGGRPANYSQRGLAWEKPAHFEYFGNNGVFQYRHNIGLRVHGGWSRANNRKSLRMYARNSYGTGSRFYYPFFGDLRAKGNPDLQVKDFRRLILRNSGNDFEATLYRDALMSDLVKHLPFTTMAFQPIIHFINGEYWGIMNLRERYDKYFLESHFGVSSEDVAILDAWGNIDEGYPEDRAHFFDVVYYAENNNPSIKSNYEWIKERVDVESLAQYYAAQIYFYNTDWPQNNMTFWRNRVGSYSVNTPQGLDGRWSWMLYDTDFGMSMWEQKYQLNGLSRVMRNDASDPSSRLFRRLLQNTEFKNQFINIVSDQLNSCFKSAYVLDKVDLFNAELSGARAEHYNRWNSGADEGGVIKTFGRERPGFVRTHTRSEFGLSSNVQLIVSKEGGGIVKVNSLFIDRNLPGLSDKSSPYPWVGIYFKNIPIKLKAIDTAGYRFSHWTGVSDLMKGEREIEVSLTESSSITAVFTQVETQLIHYWHFNDLPNGMISKVEADQSLVDIPGVIYYPGTGDGYLDRVNEGTEINARNDVEAGRALRVRNPSDIRHLEFEIPTTGFESIKVSYAVTRTANGSEEQSLFYRTSENGSWILFRENSVITEAYQQVDLDFSHLMEVNNNDYFAIRVSFTGEASSGASGNNRFDNVTVQGYSDSTGINEPEKDVLMFSVSPNPATDEVNIVSTYLLKSIELADMNGRRVKFEYADDYTHTMRISELPSGLYLLTVRNEVKTEYVKLLIR
ncbi:MAG TPA: CotH kinase family protein [Marinilabiliaceae bacterium]|nr:CotH kinase family protein [Marinilabiliaceae bacterium]